MTPQEQYTTAEGALSQCMIHHAAAIMAGWAKKIGIEPYAARLNSLEESYDRIFEWFVAQNDPDRDDQLGILTGKAFLLLDEIYRKYCAQENISVHIYPHFDEVFESIDWEEPSQSIETYGELLNLLVLKDNRVDFFPDFQERFEEAIGDGSMTLSIILAIIDSIGKIRNITKGISLSNHMYPDRFLDNLPDSWLFEVVVGEDETRLKDLVIAYLKVGRMDLGWYNLEIADKWLVKRLRTKRATARDYLNYGHCCWLIRNDRVMAYENYRTARQMYGSAKEFFSVFRPDRRCLADHEIPLDYIYLMEDQLLSVD